MAFNIKKCLIPTVYCGSGDYKTNKVGMYTKYTRNGTRHECLKKGIGFGLNNQKKDKESLTNIMYVGPKFEGKFRKKGIKTIKELLSYVKKESKENIAKLLKYVFTKDNKVLDAKGYNSTILYLYYKGIKKLPTCQEHDNEDEYETTTDESDESDTTDDD